MRPAQCSYETGSVFRLYLRLCKDVKRLTKLWITSKGGLAAHPAMCCSALASHRRNRPQRRDRRRRQRDNRTRGKLIHRVDNERRIVLFDHR
jgi:hypothetical protein